MEINYSLFILPVDAGPIIMHWVFFLLQGKIICLIQQNGKKKHNLCLNNQKKMLCMHLVIIHSSNHLMGKKIGSCIMLIPYPGKVAGNSVHQEHKNLPGTKMEHPILVSR